MNTKLFRLLCVFGAALWSSASLAEEARPASAGAGDLARTLVKEPAYQATPQYSLITLGKEAKTKVWMVEDGKRLFVDKNANGDLTDDGAPVEPSNVRSLDPNKWDFDYQLDAITPADGSRHTGFVMHRWNYGYEKGKDSYGLQLSVEGKMPMYAGWFGTFWSATRETAPVIHFGGPFYPAMLRVKEFVIGSPLDRLSLGFFHDGSCPGAESRLSIDALPRDLVPKLQIEWPAAGGSAPLRTSYSLTQRCCYWEFYTTSITVPKNIGVGKAKVSVEFSSGTSPIELTKTEFLAPVISKK